MKFNWIKMKSASEWLKKTLAIEKIEVKDNEIVLSKDQREKIEQELGAEQSAILFEKMNAELKNSEQATQAATELAAVLAEINADINATDEGAENAEATDTPIEAQATATIRRLQTENAQMSSQPIGDSPEAIYQHAVNLAPYGANALPRHTATHLFGENVDYQAIANRPWNQRALSGSASATEWNKDNIPVLQGDLEHFVRQNPTVLVTFFNEFEGLPAEWSSTPGVKDRITTASITFGEVTQARSNTWGAKGGFKISVEVGQVFAKKIDLEFSGTKLQTLENTWLANIHNMSGSHPWKMSFIGWILSEAIKQRMLEDRNAQINGIYVPTPDNRIGNAVNAQDGLLIQLYRALHTRKILRAFALGAPTVENIVDYVDRLISLVPEEYIKLQGLEIGMAAKWKLAYQQALGSSQVVVYEKDRGIFKSTIEHVKDRPNIKLQAVPDMVNSDFMYLTLSKNIDQLSYLPEEANQFTIGHDKRDTWAFADYKIGIRLQYIGIKLSKVHANKYADQVVFTNDMPIFGQDVSFPAYDNESGVLKMYYTHAKIDKEFKTDISEISDVQPGQIIKITGNTGLGVDAKVVNGADIELTSDFSLKSGGTLTLIVQADGKLKELKRTESAPTISDKVTFDNTAIDAANATEFVFDGAEAKALGQIINGVEGKQITIYGNDTAELTVSKNEQIAIAANVVLKTADDFITLAFVEGAWYEVSKQVTP